METKAGKTRVAETEIKGGKRRSRKKARRKGKTEKTEEGKGD